MPLALVLAALVAVLVAAPAAQAADPTFEAELAPSRIAFGEPAPEARLTVRTGAEPERFEVIATGAGRGFMRGDGGVLGTRCEARLEGPGRPEAVGCAVPAPAPRCQKTRLPVTHGTFAGYTTVMVDLPANSESTVVFPLAMSLQAPWTDSRYQVAFTVRGETLEAQDRRVATPEYAPAGRTGVRIELDPAPGLARLCDPVPENRGSPITVTGRAEPRLAGQEIVLRAATEERTEPVDIGTVRVAGDGTFALRDWRPRTPGHYEVGAVYRSQRGELADDFSRPLAFRLTAPVPDPPGPPGPSILPPPPPPRPHFVLVNRSLRADRGGLVRLRLWCPDRAASPCANRIRIAIGRRTVGSRTATVAPGARRTVHLRLSGAAQRRVARRRDVPATVRIDELPRIAVTLRPKR